MSYSKGTILRLGTKPTHHTAVALADGSVLAVKRAGERCSTHFSTVAAWKEETGEAGPVSAEMPQKPRVKPPPTDPARVLALIRSVFNRRFNGKGTVLAYPSRATELATLKAQEEIAEWQLPRLEKLEEELRQRPTDPSLTQPRVAEWAPNHLMVIVDGAPQKLTVGTVFSASGYRDPLEGRLVLVCGERFGLTYESVGITRATPAFRGFGSYMPIELP
jgi:hypothetical protein